VASLCHPWFTTTNLSYRFPIFETSATALCGTTGIIYNILQYFTLGWWVTLCLIGISSLIILNKFFHVFRQDFCIRCTYFISLALLQRHDDSWCQWQAAGERLDFAHRGTWTKQTTHDISWLFISIHSPWPTLTSLNPIWRHIASDEKQNRFSCFAGTRVVTQRAESPENIWEPKWWGVTSGFPFLWPLRLTYPCKARWQRREWIGKLGMRSFGCWSKDHCPLLLFQWLTKAVLLGMGPRPSGNVVTCWLTCLFHYFWELWMLWNCKVI